MLLLSILLLAGCVAVQPIQNIDTNRPIPPQHSADSEIVLLWEGEPLNAATAGACGRLQLDAMGTATVSACDTDDGVTQPLNATHAQEWVTMQARFADFHTETADGNLTFHGTGSSNGAAWQRMIEFWAQLVYTELTSDQISATGATLLNWQIGVVPDQPTFCRRLIVLTYGYAYAQVEPCVGGPAEEISGGWLNDNALIALAHWRQKLAPLYVENNYLAGSGEAVANAVDQQLILAWVVATYNELSEQVSATGPTAISWFVGETADDSGLCQHVTVLRYGYAYADSVPCSGGQPNQQTAGLLTEEELAPFVDWLANLAPLYEKNNFLNGNGSQEADAATVAAIERWATALYTRLTNMNATMAPTVAFVRDNQLYIQPDAPQGSALAIEDCRDGLCRILYPKWSPDGSRLLYYRQLLTDPYATAIFVATRDGQTHQIADAVAFYRPAAWSPDGTEVVYLRHTERFEAASQGQMRVLEVWTATVDVNGNVQTTEEQGEVGFGEGCGGGGRSNSALIYEDEGGFAYGYLAAIVEWTASDILLYSNNCTSRGVGRFDMVTGELLEPYGGALRSLSLDRSGTRWAAIGHADQLVLGSPDALTVTALTTVTLAADTTLELVFFGASSGRLYYTTWHRTGETVAFVDEIGAIDTPFIVSPYIDFMQPALYTFDIDLNESALVWQDDGYAYARLNEMADGSLFFSRVEPNDLLLNALQRGSATAANIKDLLPTADLLYLAPTAITPTLWLENANQVALFPGISQ